ncbi:hypothetical protein AGMMS49579_15540 [Spirochaetia bacterium]|nr:hypothetical protein AGMMS49579_15540 [Spirochaetia bacterium]
MDNTNGPSKKEIQQKLVLIKIFKVIIIVFFIGSLGAFISTLTYNIQNKSENIIFLIFSNIGITLLSRIVLGSFFYCFAIFVEEWLKTDE